MEYTKNYKLPQWVESDRILMEDFNQAIANIDAGLRAAKEQADSASSAAEQGSGLINDLVPRVTAVENAVKFVKLAGPVVTQAENETITVDLSGIDMSQYTCLLAIGSGQDNGSSGSGMYLSINGKSSVTVFNSTNSGYCSGMVWLTPVGNYIASRAEILAYTPNQPNELSASGEGRMLTDCAWNNVKTLLITGNPYAGTRFALYGIRG